MPKAVWYCDKCGTPWKTSDEAAGCEYGHTSIKTILEEVHDPNESYFHEPTRIKVRTSDGKEVWYDKSIDQ